MTENIKELIERLKTYSEDLEKCEYPYTMGEAADALSALTARVRELEKENQGLRANSMIQEHIISAGRNPQDKDKIIQLTMENTQLRAEMEQVKRERDTAVEDLRTTQVFANSFAFCKCSIDCDKRGPGRKSVEGCWEWCGPQKEN